MLLFSVMSVLHVPLVLRGPPLDSGVDEDGSSKDESQGGELHPPGRRGSTLSCAGVRWGAGRSGARANQERLLEKCERWV